MTQLLMETQALDIVMGILAFFIVASGLFMLLQGTSAMNDKK